MIRSLVLLVCGTVAGSLAAAGPLLPEPQFIERQGTPLPFEPEIAIGLAPATESSKFLREFLTDELTAAGFRVVPEPAALSVVLHVFAEDVPGEGGAVDDLPAGVEPFPAMGDQGYVLSVERSAGRLRCVVAAGTEHGLFHGGMTLLQLLTDGANPARPAPALTPQRILDWPDHPLRGAHLHSVQLPLVNGRRRLSDPLRRRIDALARVKVNLVFAVQEDLALTEESWRASREGLGELLRYCRERFIELVVPVVNPGSSPLVDYRDGWWIPEESFRFATVAGLGLVLNPSLEHEDDCGRPVGWEVDRLASGRWSLDRSVASHGASSMRLDVADEPVPIEHPESTGRLQLRQILPAPRPGRYAVSAWVRQQAVTEGALQATAYGVDAAGAVVAGPVTSYVPAGTSDWARVVVAPLVVGPAVQEVVIYFRIQEPGHGTAWVDDVRLFPALRRQDGGWDPDDRVTTDVAEPERPAHNLLVNSGMELDTEGTGLPAGWTVALPDSTEARWSLDETSAHCGNRSVRLDLADSRGTGGERSGDAYLAQRLDPPLEPGTYVLTLWTKSAVRGGAAQVVFFAEVEGRNRPLQNLPLSAETAEWVAHSAALRVERPDAALTVYARVREPATGTLWLDDVQIRRVDGDLRNTLRGGYDVRVRSPDGARTYVLGRDYDLVPGTIREPFDPAARPTVIRRLAGGALPRDAEVRVSYDAHISWYSGAWRVGYDLCTSRPFEDVVRPAIDRVVGDLGATSIDLLADEIRGMNRGGACRDESGSPLAANDVRLVAFLNAAVRYARSLNPDVVAYVWDDMLSPYHNGGLEDYQVDFGGPPGATSAADSLGELDPHLRLRVWWYSPDNVREMAGSLAYFGQPGRRFSTLAAPHRHVVNIEDWAALSAGQPQSLGVVATTWGQEDRVARTTDRFWNSRWRQLGFVDFERETLTYSFQDEARRDTASCAAPVFPSDRARPAGVCVGPGGGGVEFEAIPVRDARRYRVIVHAASEMLVDAYFTASWTLADGRTVESRLPAVLGGSPRFARSAVDLEPPVGAVRLGVGVVRGPGSGVLALDNLMLWESAPGCPFGEDGPGCGGSNP